MGEMTVLVVEDEESFIEALTVGLAREGFRVQVARDGELALSMFEAVKPDVVLLDVMLPKVSGIDVCRELRKRSKVPIIMVTAKGSEIDTVVGLEVGADDYVTKPYRIRELVARMRAVMRRSADAGGGPRQRRDPGRTTSPSTPSATRCASAASRCSCPSRSSSCSTCCSPTRAGSSPASTLIDRVWGSDYVGDTKTLDVHVKRLRGKVEKDPANPQRIVTIRGLGYKLEA